MIFDSTAFAAYTRKPYLINAADGAVRLRHATICANLWTAPPPGTPRLHIDQRTRSIWFRKLTEVRAEQYLRLKKSGIFTGRYLDFVPYDESRLLSMSHLADDVAHAAQKIQLPPGPFLARFTKAQFVKEALQKGRFRIAPAKSYDDQSLNEAQRDDELLHAAVRGDIHIVMQEIGYAVGEDPHTARPLPQHFLELHQCMSSHNFYTICFTEKFDARLFKDFDSDAALIIRDTESFIKRLYNSTQKLNHIASFRAGPVRYYDPYTVDIDTLTPLYSKNFSFAYQSEFRATWQTKNNRMDIYPFFIEIGDISDIADGVFI